MEEARIAVLDQQLKELGRRQDGHEARLTRLEDNDRQREMQIVQLKTQLAAWGFIGAMLGSAAVHFFLENVLRP